MYYDNKGNVVAAGAEAMKEGMYEIAQDEEWVKTEWHVDFASDVDSSQLMHFKSQV